MDSKQGFLTGSFLSTVILGVGLGISISILISGSKRLFKSTSIRHGSILSLIKASWQLKSVARKRSKVKDNLWNDVIFFPSRPDDPNSSIDKLLFYLQEAESSLKLCIMTLTYDPVYSVLIQKHQEGVQVLVFTSFNVMNGKGMRLRDKGIGVRSKTKGDYSTEMHNKYVIVDDEAVMTGSLNWSAESIFHQCENLLITNEEIIVSKFCNNFDYMWNDSQEVDILPS